MKLCFIFTQDVAIKIGLVKGFVEGKHVDELCIAYMIKVVLKKTMTVQLLRKEALIRESCICTKIFE